MMKSDSVLDRIRTKLTESNPEKRTLIKIFQFNFTSNDGEVIKRIVMDLRALKIYDGTTDSYDCEITVNDDDFYMVGTKQIPFHSLVDEGKVQINGDKEAFDQMVQKFDFFGKKCEHN